MRRSWQDLAASMSDFYFAVGSVSAPVRASTHHRPALRHSRLLSQRPVALGRTLSLSLP